MGGKRFKSKNKYWFIKMIIIVLLLSIILYMIYGIYRENKIRTLHEESLENIRIEQMNDDKNMTIENVMVNPIIDEIYEGYDVCAKLEIVKLNLDIFVLEPHSIEAMKVSATKFWGPEPNEEGNFCIAGHNKEGMFNHLIDLNIGDEIYLTDNKNGKYTYTIYDIYKVKPENLEPINQETNGKTEITLITCANYSKKRLIIKAEKNQG